VVSALIRQIFEGNVGDKLLELRDRLRKRVKETKLAGTEPVKEFALRSSEVNFVKLPRKGGMVPIKEFAAKLIQAKSRREPSDEGIELTKRLL
jgi:hypothetical protein